MRKFFIWFLGLVLILFFLYSYVNVIQCDGFSFLEDKIDTGTALNNFSAPIIGIIGVILVSVSFFSQLRANKLLQDQNLFTQLNSQIESLKTDIQKLYVDKFDKSLPTLISDIVSGKDRVDGISNHFLFVLRSYYQIGDFTLKSNLKSKAYILGDLQSIYSTYLKTHLDKFKEDDNRDSKNHWYTTINMAKACDYIFNEVQGEMVDLGFTGITIGKLELNDNSKFKLFTNTYILI